VTAPVPLGPAPLVKGAVAAYVRAVRLASVEKCVVPGSSAMARLAATVWSRKELAAHWHDAADVLPTGETWPARQVEHVRTTRAARMAGQVRNDVGRIRTYRA